VSTSISLSGTSSGGRGLCESAILRFTSSTPVCLLTPWATFVVTEKYLPTLILINDMEKKAGDDKFLASPHFKFALLEVAKKPKMMLTLTSIWVFIIFRMINMTKLVNVL
jgi:hypothetical protein